MGVTSVTLRSAGEHSLANNAVSERDVYLVTSTAGTSAVDVRDASGIPAYYQRHPTQLNLYAASKRVRQISGTGTQWEVEVEWTGEYYGAPWPENVSDLIGRDPDVEWGTEETVESVDTDVSGRKIQNSVFEDIDPPLTATRSYVSLVISRNESFNEFSAAKAASFVDHVNAGQFFGAAARSVLCKRITARLVKAQSFQYWRVTYVFWFKVYWLPCVDLYNGTVVNEPWGSRVANTGRRTPKLTSEAGRFAYEPIKDANGDPVTDPVPIGLDGIPISQSQGASTVWVGWKTYADANFGALGLE